MSKYNYEKRMSLKKNLKDQAALIVLLKDQRKMHRNRKYPEFVRPSGVWLDNQQCDFRHQHIAASMMRGKTLSQIETLPKGYKWKGGQAIVMENGRRIPYPLLGKIYYMPDMQFVQSIIVDHLADEATQEKYRKAAKFNEDVCIGSENPLQESASGTSRTRFG